MSGHKMSGHKMSGHKMSGHKMPWVNIRGPRGQEVARRQIESTLGHQGAKRAGGRQGTVRENYWSL